MEERLLVLKSYMSQSDYQVIKAAAKRARQSVSEWSRQALLAAAQADAARDGLTEVQEMLNRTLRSHLRHVAGLVASALREAAIARKLAEQAVYLTGFPELSQKATRRLGPQGVLLRAEQYAQDQVRRASERVGWLSGSEDPAKAAFGRKRTSDDDIDDFAVGEVEEDGDDGGAA